MTQKSGPPPIVYLLLGLSLTGGGYWLWSRQPTVNLPNPMNQAPIARGTLRLLGDTFSGYSTFRNPGFQTALTDTGITLQYADEFDQAKRAASLTQGQADLLVTTLDQFVKHKPAGKIVGLIDRTIGADAVVLNTKQYPVLKSLLDVNPFVKTVQAQGKSPVLTFAGDTPSEYLAIVLSTKFEAFKLSDFQVAKVSDASEAWKKMQDPSQNVAIAVLWEPYVTQARQQGNTVVLSSRDTPNTIVDVIVASDRLMQSQPESISQFLEVYYRRIDSTAQNNASLKQQIAEDGKLSNPDAVAVLKGIHFFTSLEAKRWFTDGTLEKRIGSTAAVLTLAGQLNQIPQNSKNLFTPQFMVRAIANTQTLIDLIRASDPELAARLAGTQPAKAAVPQPNSAQVRSALNIGNLAVRGQVSFTVGSAQLTSAGQNTLNTLVQEIGDFNTQTVAVRVIGHTSQIGAADLNQRLSQQRAQVVVDYLRSLGLKHKIIAEGQGFNQPLPGIAPTDSRNQRTEIRLVRIDS
jgi:outer membrane protein OmpA-like peptidoglycan-associated protein